MKELKTINGVVALMSKSSTEDEWNDNGENVKSANNGEYPWFWDKVIVERGILKMTSKYW